jgi:hypothetical protein
MLFSSKQKKQDKPAFLSLMVELKGIAEQKQFREMFLPKSVAVVSKR